MRSRPEKPVCREYGAFLQQQLGPLCLAPLTGQDAAALDAFVHTLHLWGRGDARGRELAETAMVALALAMQPQTRHLAKRVIPRVLDWGHEDEIWLRIFPAGAAR